MARKNIADKEPAISKEGAALPDSKKARAPRASANAVTHRHKKTAESQTPAPSAKQEKTQEPPSREEIAIRAYLLAESRGFQGGSPDHDWLNAERQLLAERSGISSNR